MDSLQERCRAAAKGLDATPSKYAERTVQLDYGAWTLREAADALDARDAEIARLNAGILGVAALAERVLDTAWQNSDAVRSVMNYKAEHDQETAKDMTDIESLRSMISALAKGGE